MVLDPAEQLTLQQTAAAVQSPLVPPPTHVDKNGFAGWWKNALYVITIVGGTAAVMTWISSRFDALAEIENNHHQETLQRLVRLEANAEWQAAEWKRMSSNIEKLWHRRPSDKDEEK